jgi:hypothetical protein
MKATAFQVFQEMHETNNRALKLAPLGNLVRAKKTKAGTEITIGVPGDVVTPFVMGSLIGGLIFCDADEFERVLAEMERRATQ